ncbi:MAG: ergothioneine biosynthesis protein EgtB [Aquisalimonadaceae bacterium]
MTAQIERDLAAPADTGLAARYQQVRSTTLDLCRTLGAEDQVIQSMPDVSPTKWHLAHTTWFFEEFILAAHSPGYQRFHRGYAYLFNSYYNGIGRMHPRAQRGLLSRPTVTEINAYRAYVDEHMTDLLGDSGCADALRSLILLGTHHEQQHQELLLMDIKHVFSINPLLPAYHEAAPRQPGEARPLAFIEGETGVVETGCTDAGFCFDNERPRHRSYLQPHALADRLVTNGEYLAFIQDGGYRQPELWLSDGWSTVQQLCWTRPLYWNETLDGEFTLAGLQPLDPAAPVCHVSYYEADAYARWANARLPTETEWERLALRHGCDPNDGNFQDDGHLHPQPASGAAPAQLLGDVWEWTSSAYSGYPGYRPPQGAIGEYNGKFMCNQMVLRGGACVTPRDHIRASYRNFFYPDARWPFTGIRLARDTT